MTFEQKGNILIACRGGEILRLEPWGPDALRVRAAMYTLPEKTEDWALTEAPAACTAEIRIGEVQEPNGDGTSRPVPCAEIRNGRMRATVNFAGVLSFYRDDRLVLREYYRSYGGTLSRGSRCLKIVNREWKGIIGGSEFALTVRYDPNEGEKLFGMGQYQQPWLDLKGASLELAQRNSQITVPFLLSSLGYGFLWNNPAVGRAVFARNLTEWRAESTRVMDLWICAGENPKDLLAKYTAVTGHAPMFPENLMGLWQCKLRYRTQEEVLSIARKYREEGIHIDQIVIDFFHWTVQ